MTRFEAVFMATPAVGNLVPTVEFAKLLTKHHPRLSASILIITPPQRPIIKTYVQSRASSSTNLRFIHLPAVDPPTPDQYQSSVSFVSLLIQKYKPHIRDELLKLMNPSGSNTDPVRIAGLFVDMFSTTIIDVAEEFGVPSYLFFASPASFFGLMLHLPQLDSQLKTESPDPRDELEVPGFKNRLPRPVLPNLVLKVRADGYSWLLSHAERYKKTKGIVINTVQELESSFLDSLFIGPRVYPIGPVLDHIGLSDPNPAHFEHVIKWLDEQPQSSVVFLCFGSMGSLSVTQIREIAMGLEGAGHRFLWILREPPKGKLEDPTDCTNPETVLPVGFLERTAQMGFVSGWVPQVKILAHKAIGGFVSHCGWNSILESLWYGVPIATWPIYAEQQMNAFEMVKELGLALEIRLDYKAGSDLVCAKEVERGIRGLMDGADEIRKKVKEMGEKCRMALLTENGSSFKNLVSLIGELTANN